MKIRIIIWIFSIVSVGLVARPGALAGPSPSPSGSPLPTPSTSPTIPQCSDDIDNDDDGWVDFDGNPAGRSPDPSCVSLEDDSEFPYSGGDRESHSRAVTFARAEHEARRERRVLIIRGNVVTFDGADQCSSDVPIIIQRRIDGTWTKVNRGRTHERDADGDGDYRFRLTVGDLQGRYRLLAPSTTDDAPEFPDSCLTAHETLRHRH